MSRPRKNALFELGGHWIAKEPGIANYYRYWTEPGTGTTRRASLGTADFESAKIAFAQAVLVSGEKTSNSPLSAVLEDYFQERTDKLPSKKHARLAGKTLLRCWGTTIRVNQITDAKQKQFAEWSVAQNHSLSYISRNLSVLAAACAYAKLPTKIFFGKEQIKKRWTLQTKAKRVVHIPTDKQMAQFFALKLTPDFFRWAAISCLTVARPEAALDLAPAQRIGDVGLIDLNPPGRVQTSKY